MLSQFTQHKYAGYVPVFSSVAPLSPKILSVVAVSYNFHIPHVLVTINCARHGGWVADYLTQGGNLHISYDLTILCCLLFTKL